ncbi:hypothetical protein [Candidatus Regiella endosymbiont of Tuberolachnus salignus]|uniref:hypothetical protein n=1 Tax=Candidatus Regiella endosymbiont of Tuberolachnus salignus TaxID=3077956 RepID=UPI0030CBBC94
MKFFVILCTILMSLLFNILSLYAKELTLPKPTGIYSVGTQAIELQDPLRLMLRGNETRRWMVQFFYPAMCHSGAYPYMPGTLEEGIVEGEKVISFAKPNAVPIISQQFPLIIAIPGRGEERQRETVLYEELASQGYAVLAMDQSYVTNFVKFPDGSKIAPTFKDAWNVSRNRDYRYAYDDEVIEGYINDIAYVLDNLKTLGGISSTLDPDKVILMGRSLGANVAHIMGFTDPRIKAIVDIDSKITEREVFGRVGVPPNPFGKPVLFIRGMMQYQEDVADQLNKIQNATVWIPHVQHSAFSDDAYFAAKIEGFGKNGFFSLFLNWLFKRGPHWSNVNTDLGGMQVDEWFDEYRAYVVGWLDKQNRSRNTL